MWNTFLTKTYSAKYLLLSVSNFWLLLPYTQGRMLQKKNIDCTPERYLKRSLGENNILKRWSEKRLFSFALSFFFALSLLKIFFKKQNSPWSKIFLGRKTLLEITLPVVTVAMICSTLVSLEKFQYFRRPIYNPTEHLWWGFYC